MKQNTLVQDFTEIRRVSTPIFLVLSPDYRAAIKELAEVRLKDEEDHEVPLVYWDLVAGHRGLNKAGVKAANNLGESASTVNDPALLLKRTLGWTETDLNGNEVKHPPLPGKGTNSYGTILFMVFPNDDVVQAPTVAQAMANVRNEFKTDRRTLVVLGRDLKLPALIAEDVPIHVQPLPDEKAIVGIVESVYDSIEIKPDQKEIDKALTFLRGMTGFAVEEAVARKLSKKNGLDLDGLASVQKEVIQQTSNRALTFDTFKTKFDDIGGQAAIKDYFEKLFAGPKAPRVVIRIDEIEKSINASASGIVQDNTGVSQDQLKTLLTAMEDNRWGGAILIGGPGTGKTACTTCVANTFKCLGLVGDLGSTKASLVGESEARIRRLVEVLKSLGGDRVLILGTCNKLGVMPPELLRRFNHGIWYFETPNAAERKAIWSIQAKAFGISLEQEIPEDDDWVGSDIRNCFTPDRRLLGEDLRWKEAGNFRVGDVILGFDEHGPARKYQPSVVESVTFAKEPVIEVVLENGYKFAATPYHQILVYLGKKQHAVSWKRIDQLQVGYTNFPRYLETWNEDLSKDAGWLAGIFDGEGCLGMGGPKKQSPGISVAQNPGLIHDKIELMLRRHGIDFRLYSAAGFGRDCEVFSLCGGLPVILQFLGSIRPERLLGKLTFGPFGRMQCLATDKVVSAKSIGKKDIVKIQTSTKTLIVDGYPHHNCCEKAWMLNCSLKEAAETITISGQVSEKDINQLRDLAEKSQFRCASFKGAYKREHKANKPARSIVVDDAVDALLAKKKEGKK